MMIKMNFEVCGDASEAREFLAALVASLNSSGAKPTLKVVHTEPKAEPVENVAPIEAPAPAAEVETPKRTRGRPRADTVAPLAPVAPAPVDRKSVV